MRAAEPADDSARSALASGVHCRADDSRISEEIAHGVGAAGADGRCGSDSTRFALASGVHCWADDSLLQLSLSSVNRDRQRGMRDRPEGRRLGSSDLFRASVGLYGGFLTVARLCMPSTCWRAAMLHRCAFEGCPKTVEWPEVFLVAARGLVVGRRCDVLQASWRRGLQGDIGKRGE